MNLREETNVETPITGTTLDDAMIRLAEDTRSYAGKEAVNAAIGVIPVVGHSIVALMGDIATSRLRERIIEVAKIMTERINALDEGKIETGYFQTEEFQTILVLTFEQLRTTHDKGKIRMLGTALANGGNTDFKSETRKEFMFRIIRDLSPIEVQRLQSMMPIHPHIFPEVKDPDGSTQSIFARLHTFGLVAEEFESRPLPSIPNFGGFGGISESTVSQFFHDALKPPIRVYTITDFGIAFVRFLTEESVKVEESEP